MPRITHRARKALAATAATAASLFMGACNPKQELLAPQQPGVIDPSSVASATAADAFTRAPLAAGKTQ